MDITGDFIVIRPLAAACLLAFAPLLPAAEPAKTREFNFRYEATVTGMKPGQNTRVWLPVASSSEDQKVEIVKREVPGDGKIEKESKYGNQILYAEVPADPDGKVTLAVTYRVKR